MAYYKFTWNRILPQTYPNLKFKSVVLVYDTNFTNAEYNFTNSYFPSSLSLDIGNAINNIGNAEVQAIEYKTTKTTNNIKHELVINTDIPAPIYAALIKVADQDDENVIYLNGEYIADLPVDFEIFSICSPIITTSTTTTTTVAP